MANKDYWVDYAKAIGIILVVYGHVSRGVYNAGIDIPVAWHEKVDSIIYSFHMPLFFFLSGLFFYGSFFKRGARKLIFSKVDTIVYPYIVWSILQGLVEVFLADYINGHVSYSDVFSLLWAPRAQFWFLYALFVIFCVSSIVFSFVRQGLVVLVFVLSTVVYLYPFILPDYFVFRFISANLVYFIFGVVFSLYFRAEKLSSTACVCLLAIGFGLCQFLFHYTFGLRYWDKGGALLLVSLLSIIFIVSFSAWASLKPNRLTAYIGASSLAIYLMHIFAASGVRVLLLSFGVDSFVWQLAVGSFVGLFVPMLALVSIQKLKVPYLFSAPISDVAIVLYRKGANKV